MTFTTDAEGTTKHAKKLATRKKEMNLPLSSTSFPSSGLGTHSREAPLRNASIPSTQLRTLEGVTNWVRATRSFARCQAELGDQCVPKLELGNEERDHE